VSGDLFGDEQFEPIRLRTPPQREWPEPEPPGLLGLAVVAALAVPPAWLFGMGRGTTALFVVGCVATRAAKNHRWLQQTLRVAAATIYFSYAELTFTVAFPPIVRLVFYGVIIGAVVALYEWAVPN
jgi:hypothetical protein